MTAKKSLSNKHNTYNNPEKITLTYSQGVKGYLTVHYPFFRELVLYENTVAHDRQSASEQTLRPPMSESFSSRMAL